VRRTSKWLARRNAWCDATNGASSLSVIFNGRFSVSDVKMSQWLALPPQKGLESLSIRGEIADERQNCGSTQGTESGRHNRRLRVAARDLGA
jgi:hypothetical protein